MRIILFVIIFLFNQSDILNSKAKDLNFKESAELFIEKLGITIDTNSLEDVFEEYNNVFLSIMQSAKIKMQSIRIIL